MGLLTLCLLAALLSPHVSAARCSGDRLVGDDDIGFTFDASDCESVYVVGTPEEKMSINAVRAVAEALKGNDMIRTLDIGWNNIGNKGAELVAEGILENEGLQTITMTWNRIGDLGATALAKAFASHKKIHQIELGGARN
jgi:Ran GTPase-activating protein (RanGAP) involved in mRNA processing and transport